MRRKKAPANAPHAIEPCERLENCGFFEKYRATKDLACRGFMRLYCMGPKQSECRRKTYWSEHGVPPSDDIMPSGLPIALNTAIDRD